MDFLPLFLVAEQGAALSAGMAGRVSSWRVIFSLEGNCTPGILLQTFAQENNTFAHTNMCVHGNMQLISIRYNMV